MTTNDRAAAAEAIIAQLRPPGRECGECQVCCDRPSIAALGKPVNQLCRHAAGGRCAIYQSRPGICRGFACRWLLDSQMGDALRPDRSGIMLAYATEPDGSGWLTIHVDQGREPDWRAAIAAMARHELVDTPSCQTRVVVSVW